MKFAIHWKRYYFVNVHAKTFRHSSRMRERMEFFVRFSFITIGFRLIHNRLQCVVKQCTIFLTNIEK